MIYLDNAATTFCLPSVAEALGHFYKTPHGNPSALHELGVKSANTLNEAHHFFANHFKVKPEQVVFTASGTEANNLGLSGYLSRKKTGKILTSPIEHSSILRTLEKWSERGFKLEFLKIDSSGHLNLEDLKLKLTDDVEMISLMAVNNEIATIEDIQKIGSIIKNKNHAIHFHVDAVQAFGKVPLEFSFIDTLSISSHKIHGPVGAGALIMREGVQLEPLLLGGGQEHGLRSGTESLGMIYAFHCAAKEILSHQLDSFEKTQNLKNKFIEGLKQLPHKIKINSSYEGSPYILNVSFIGIGSEIMLRFLEQEGIYASAGSSCNMKRRRPSHVLKAIGCTEDEAFSAIRFSFSPYTTQEDIEQSMTAISSILSHLKGMKLFNRK